MRNKLHIETCIGGKAHFPAKLDVKQSLAWFAHTESGDVIVGSDWQHATDAVHRCEGAESSDLAQIWEA